MKPIATKYRMKGSSDYDFKSENILSLDDIINIEDIIKYWSDKDMKDLIEQFDDDSDDVFPEHCSYSYILTSKSKDLNCVLAYIDNVINPYVRIDYNAPANRTSPLVPNGYGNFSDDKVRSFADKWNSRFPIIGYGFPAFLATNADVNNGDIDDNPDDIIKSYFEERQQLFRVIHSEEYRTWNGRLKSQWEGAEAKQRIAELDNTFVQNLLKQEKDNITASSKLLSLYDGILDKYIGYNIQYLKDNAKRLSLFIK